MESINLRRWSPSFHFSIAYPQEALIRSNEAHLPPFLSCSVQATVAAHLSCNLQPKSSFTHHSEVYKSIVDRWHEWAPEEAQIGEKSNPPPATNHPSIKASLQNLRGKKILLFPFHRWLYHRRGWAENFPNVNILCRNLREAKAYLVSSKTLRQSKPPLSSIEPTARKQVAPQDRASQIHFAQLRSKSATWVPKIWSCWLPNQQCKGCNILALEKELNVTRTSTCEPLNKRWSASTSICLHLRANSKTLLASVQRPKALPLEIECWPLACPYWSLHV